MGIEQIVGKIIDDAREKAAAIRADLDEKVARLEERWKEEQGIRRSEASDALDAATARERERLLTAEKLESRKRRLGLKRELVDDAFAKARDAFLELPDKEYRPLLANLIASAALTGTEEVILGEKDHKKFGKKVVADANELLEARGLEKQLTLADEPGPHDAGAVLRHNRVEVRRTLDELILEVRERLEGSVATVLFEDEA